MRNRHGVRSLKGLDLAELNARQGNALERAQAFARVALDAARQEDGPRMARCLEIAQRERRNLRLADQVAVLDCLARAAHAANAAAFARLLLNTAIECARRIRHRDRRVAAQAICGDLASLLNEASKEHPRCTTPRTSRTHVVISSLSDTRMRSFA